MNLGFISNFLPSTQAEEEHQQSPSVVQTNSNSGRKSVSPTALRQLELERENKALYVLGHWQSQTFLRRAWTRFTFAVHQSSPKVRRSPQSAVINREQAEERQRNIRYVTAMAERERHGRIQSMIYDMHEFRVTFTRPTPHLGLDLTPNEVKQHVSHFLFLFA